MWTNAGVKQMIDNFGHRICAIHLNNGKTMLIDYRGEFSTKLEDISLETIGGCDCLLVQHTDISSGKEVKFTSYVTTEFIEGFDIMSENDKDYRIDPLIVN